MLKLARAIANLEHNDTIKIRHLTKVIQYRPKSLLRPEVTRSLAKECY
ncbi:hypothetical protein ACFLT8_04445 [Chloroflexota bacterium]